MKKLHVALCVMIASAALLTGCGDNAAPVTGSDAEVIESTVTPTESTAATETAATTETVETVIDDSIPPEEGMVRSRFTNEWIDEDLYDQRPLAVMIPNESAAIPHYGLSEASILYEANVEGRMTRMMAIFEDYESVEKIGNIRSFREYYGYWAFEWDSIITSYGGTIYDEALRERDTTDHLNGNVYQSRSGSPFYRSADRSAPHNAYINGSKVKDFLETLGFEEKDRGLADETHYNFTTPSNLNTLTQYSSAEDATYVDMTACYPLTKCYFEYNEADGLYYRSQHVSNGTDGPHIDGANGQQLAFTNLIIQSCEYAVRDAKGYLWFQTIDSGRDAWYVTQGKMIKCTWEKESEYGATRYYDEDGNEITLNTGKTMVLIIEDGDMFDYE
ncbi:MAG: DUF3048 domain-containing protein [Lachnospiraceae bacterium]|nr:DUF3048 domain-containing protein [Lachnospiraceae bacterium]